MSSLTSGIVLTIIGIALILWGVFLWITVPSYSFDRIGAFYLWPLGGILFLTGVGLLAHSVSQRDSTSSIRKIRRKIRRIQNPEN